MEPQRLFIERRKHPRYYPDRKNQPKVSFVLNGREKIAVEVVNISCGGLFGYASSADRFVEIDYRKVPVIEIGFPEKQLFSCSGTLVRVQPARQKNKCFCAISFDQVGFDENKKYLVMAEEIEQLQKPIPKIIIKDQQFMTRIKRAENYTAIKDPQMNAKTKRYVYDSFDDVTAHLSLEEQCWFFEILDEMKRREPNYPDDLKRAFLNLCRSGMEQFMKNHQKSVLL